MYQAMEDCVVFNLQSFKEGSCIEIFINQFDNFTSEMAPRKVAEVRNYFSYNETTLMSKCLCNVDDNPTDNNGRAEGDDLMCKKLLSSNRVSNLEYHVKAHHPKIFKELMKQKNISASAIDSKRTAASISNYFKMTSQSVVNVRYSRQEILKAILLLVTQEGRPFSALNDESFSTVYGKAMQALNMKITRCNVGKYIKEAADYIRNKMKILFYKSRSSF